MIQLYLYSSFSFLFIHARGRRRDRRKDMTVWSEGSRACRRGNAAIAGLGGVVVAGLGVCVFM
jgi:hypothetical protein